MESGNTEISTPEMRAYQDGYDAARGRGRYDGVAPKSPLKLRHENYSAWYDGFRDGVSAYMESIRIGI